MVKSIEDNN